MATYEQELAKFKQQWNLPGYDLHQLANSAYALRYADSFLTGASVDNSPAAQFVKWFSRTLSHYFETHTTPNQDGNYISSFDTQTFYNSFKALVQAKYDADAEEKDEFPLKLSEVLTEDLKPTIQNTIANCKRRYQKTLPTLWQENLKNGDLKLDTLKNITDNSYNSFNPEVDAQEQVGKFKNLLAAREAMQQLRASRSGLWGWLWKVVFNRSQNRQEKEYLQDLNNKINEFSDTYNIEEMVAELTGKTVLGKDLTAKEKTQENPTTVVEKAKTVEKPLMDPVASKTAELLNNNSIKGKVVENLNGKLPVDSQGDMMFKMTVQSVTNRFIADKIQPLNEDFDKGIAKGKDPKKEIGHVVRKIFVEAVKTFGRLTSYEDFSVKNEALKIFTKEMVNNFTAAAINPDLGEAVNGYVELNANRYEKLVSERKDFVEEMEVFEERLKSGLDKEAEPVEKVFDGNDNPFAENDANKSVPINSQPQHSVPTVTNNK